MSTDQHSGHADLRRDAGQIAPLDVVVMGTTASGDIRRLAGALRVAGNGVTAHFVLADDLMSRLRPSKSSHTLVLVETLAERLDSSLLDETTVELIVATWLAGVEDLLRLLRRRRRQISVVGIREALAKPEFLAAALSDRLEAKVSLAKGVVFAPLPATSHLSQVAEALAMFAAPRVTKLASELAANALLGTTLPALDETTALSSLTVLRAGWNKLEAEAEIKSAHTRLLTEQAFLMQQSLQEITSADAEAIARLTAESAEVRRLAQIQIKEAALRLSEAEAGLAAKTDEATRFAFHLAETEAVLQTRQDEASLLAFRLAMTETVLQIHQGKAAQLSAQLAESNALQCAFQAAVSERDLRIAQQEAECQALLKSNSWRVTEPFRATKLAVKRSKT